MENFQAKMFNKKASNPKSKPNQIIEAIALKPGQNIADIGAGGGYFSLRFSKIVGQEGKVYAVDTSLDFFEFIKKAAILRLTLALNIDNGDCAPQYKYPGPSTSHIFRYR